MRFLVDADLSPAIASLLQSAGHDAAYVPDLFPPRTPDPMIAAHARSSERCIITRDFGFADVRHYPPRQYFGIVVLTVPSEGGSRYITDLVREFLADLPNLEPLAGRLVVVEPGRIRTRS